MEESEHTSVHANNHFPTVELRRKILPLLVLSLLSLVSQKLYSTCVMRFPLFSLLACSIYFVFVWARFDPVTILPLNRDSMNKLSRSEFVFGKDRELFHASIDLKWVVGIISNKNTWVTLFSNVLEKFKRLHGQYDTLIKYREIASDILLKLQSHDEYTDLR